ncbi:MAG: carbon starvation protein A [Acidobacteriota bacterium]
MNIVPILTAGYGALAAGYNSFKRSITAITSPDDNNPTPSHLRSDGADYVPTKPLVLFGHHWMSIAGTSPIIASIVGLVWGWGPALLWMVLGVIFIGGVHDYFALMVSVRHQGKSMGEVVRETLGSFSGTLTIMVLAFGGILVYAIFLSVIAGALAKNPTAAIPTLALIPLAVFCGFLLKRGVSLITATAIGVALALVFLAVGIRYPLMATPVQLWGGELHLFSESFWIYFFVLYTFAAVSTPVWALLQPRDYLNSAVLVIGLLLGIGGILVGMPSVKFPFFNGFSSSVRGPLWPMLFVTISCGAASGWHSLIAAGTTSKQLDRESHGFRIAYGGMMGETVMAFLSASLIITTFSYREFLATGLSSSSIGELFASALGAAMSHLGISSLTGSTLGAVALAALTLTTLDSFARTSRYVLQEIGSRTPLRRPLVSAIIVTLSGFLLYKFVPFMDLWNGLVLGGLLLLVLPFVIIIIERKRATQPKPAPYFLHLILPLVFLYPTTMAGLLYLLYVYMKGGNWVSSGLNLLLIVLAVSLTVQSWRRLRVS